ncbi:MAG TPA: hypothetical protein VI259_07800 [Gemmatimonadaceae bacterium]
MRRLLAVLAFIATTSCTDSTLGPVQTIDGTWSGVDNGYSLSLSLAQDASGAVTGAVSLANLTGVFQGTVSGTFVRPDVHLKFNIPGVEEIAYDGTMSTTEAKIFARMNGAGINNAEVDVRKR